MPNYKQTALPYIRFQHHVLEWQSALQALETACPIAAMYNNTPAALKCSFFAKFPPSIGIFRYKIRYILALSEFHCYTNQ